MEKDAFKCALAQLRAAGLLDHASDRRWSVSPAGKAVLYNRSRWKGEDLTVIGNCIQGPSSFWAKAEDLQRKRIDSLEKSIIALMGRYQTGLTGWELLQQINREQKQRSGFSRFFFEAIRTSRLARSLPGSKGEEGLSHLKSQLKALEELGFVSLSGKEHRCMLAQRGEQILKAPHPSLGLRLQPTDLDKIIGNTLALLEQHKKQQQQAVLKLIETVSHSVEGLQAAHQKAVQQADVLTQEINLLEPKSKKPPKERVLRQSELEESLLELDFNAMKSLNAEATAYNLLQALETTCAMYHTWLHQTNLQLRDLYQARLNLEQDQIHQEFKSLQQQFSLTGHKPSSSGKAIQELAAQLVNLIQSSAFDAWDEEGAASELHLEQKANAIITLQQLTKRVEELRSEVVEERGDLLTQLESEIEAQPKAKTQK